MKKRCLLFLTIVVPSLLLVTCSSKDSIFPLTAGMHSEYEIVGDNISGSMAITNMENRQIEGQDVTPRKYGIEMQVPFRGVTTQTAFVFVAHDKNGYYEVARQSPTDLEPIVKFEKNYFLKYPLEIGTTWEAQSETSLIFTNDPVEITVQAKIEAIDETVTVPAGTFEKCTRVSAAGSATKKVGLIRSGIGLGSSAEITIEEDNWFCPGQGLVKGILIEKSNLRMADNAQLLVQLSAAAGS